MPTAYRCGRREAHRALSDIGTPRRFLCGLPVDDQSGGEENEQTDAFHAREFGLRTGVRCSVRTIVGHVSMIRSLNCRPRNTIETAPIRRHPSRKMARVSADSPVRVTSVLMRPQ